MWWWQLGLAGWEVHRGGPGVLWWRLYLAAQALRPFLQGALAHKSCSSPHLPALQMIEAAGFRGVDYENLTFGVVAIHSGFKLG